MKPSVDAPTNREQGTSTGATEPRIIRALPRSHHASPEIIPLVRTDAILFNQILDLEVETLVGSTVSFELEIMNDTMTPMAGRVCEPCRGSAEFTQR